jgi:hypothetical protein
LEEHNIDEKKLNHASTKISNYYTSTKGSHICEHKKLKTKCSGGNYLTFNKDSR